MYHNSPLVSIGLAVYNGECYLAGAIEALLSQDYGNLELIICDNASTDATQQICQQYKQRDSRIHYVRNGSNIGASNNFNKTFQLANGEFFMWAACDDLWEKSFIRKCMKRLHQQPHAVMCLTDTQNIDKDGKEIGNFGFIDETAGLSVVERLKRFFAAAPFGWHMYGLYRSSFLKYTNLLSEEYGTDILLGLEIQLLGTVVKVNEKLFYYRIFEGKTHYDQIKTITTNTEKQREIAQAAHTQLLKNMYNILIQGQVSSQTIQDFLDAFVFYQKHWVRQILFEQSYLFHGQIISLGYVREFLEQFVSSEQSPEQVARSLENPVIWFQKLVAKRPIVIIGLHHYCVTAQHLLCNHNIPVYSILDQNSPDSDIKALQKFVSRVEKSERPFIIIASDQSYIFAQQLAQVGYQHQEDFLQMDIHPPFLYLM